MFTLDHAGVGRDGEVVEARVARRQVAFQDDLAAGLGGGRLHGGREIEPVLRREERRVEDMDDAIAGFDRQRGAHHAGVGAPDHGQVLRHRAEALDAGGRALAATLIAPALEGLARGQGIARREGIGLDVEVARGVLGRDPGQGFERQAQADRAVAGDQEQMVVAGRTSGPIASGGCRPG